MEKHKFSIMKHMIAKITNLNSIEENTEKQEQKVHFTRKSDNKSTKQSRNHENQPEDD